MTRPFKFIHLTDTHVVGPPHHLYGSDPRLRLAQAVASINAEHGDARHVVITGDLTHWGDQDAYDAFSQGIEALNMPVVLMMGNHDATEAFIETFPDAPMDQNGFVQSSLQTEHGLMLFLDTSMIGTHAGGYCQRRQDWLSAQLDNSTCPVFLFMHHPPFAVGIAGMDAIMMQDAAAFWEILAPHQNRIRHLFFGHLHRTLYGNWRGISFSCMPGLNHQVMLDLNAAPEIIHGNLQPPAYGVVLVSEDQLLVHQHAYLDNSPSFTLGPPEGVNARDYALGMAHKH
jgi:3',5'-cyclic AMP phosphodiesterase CpdA